MASTRFESAFCTPLTKLRKYLAQDPVLNKTLALVFLSMIGMMVSVHTVHKHDGRIKPVPIKVVGQAKFAMSKNHLWVADPNRGFISPTANVDGKVQNSVMVPVVTGVLARGSQYIDIYEQASERYGVPLKLLMAQGWIESKFNPNAIRLDPNGSEDRGIAQINSAAFHEITDTEAFDPSFAIDWQANQMSSLYKEYGNWIDALSAYNSGLPLYEVPSTYDKQVNDYVYNILSLAGMSG